MSRVMDENGSDLYESPVGLYSLSRPLPLLSTEKTRPLSYITFFVCNIAPLQTATLIALLPAYKQQHLKRVKSVKGINSVLILPTEESTLEMIHDLLKTVENNNYMIETVNVPQFAPKTKKQYLDWKNTWPLNWHSSTDGNDLLTDDDYLKYKTIMEKLITFHLEKTLDKGLQTDTNPSRISNSSAEFDVEAVASSALNPNTCLVVDPTDEAIISLSSTGAYPLHHAAMIAINNVADIQINSGKGYLCTGYDVYMYYEPCHM
jgi:hypothetical protein